MTLVMAAHYSKRWKAASAWVPISDLTAWHEETRQRDLRYWSERQRTAEVVAPPVATATVRFGSSVALRKQDGQGIRYQIVGEDEADPANGRISYVSPISRLLIGAAVGDVVALADGEAEILEIG
jgi:transcription elongation GreA/GreB family factor